MSKLSVDFETRSAVDLRTRGAPLYFESDTTIALLLAYCIDGGPIQLWQRGEPEPIDLREAIIAGAAVHAHNAAFERRCFAIQARQLGWAEPRPEQFYCSMATAAALGLPRSLDKLGMTLNAAQQKDKEGAALIQFFCVPKGATADGAPIFNEPVDHPIKFKAFGLYCMQDVAAEMAISRRLITLSDFEHRVWLLDQTINERGVRLDRASAARALSLVEAEQADLDRQIKTVTNGDVARCSEVAKLTAWLQDNGAAIDGLAKDDVLQALKIEDLPHKAMQALDLRQQAAKSSTSKLKAMLKRVNADDRLRDMFNYHGAGPGRWTSSGGVNISNLPRPRPLYGDAHLNPYILFQAIRTGNPDVLRALYGAELGRPLDLVSDALRSFLWAAPGHDLIAVDYASIQGRLAMWFSREEWKLKAVRAIDADPKNEPDLYRRAAAAITGLSTDVITKKHPLRQSIGKVSELSLGFGAGVAGFESMARNYNVDLDALFEPVWGTASEETRERAVKRYEKCCKSKDRAKTDVLSREAWLSCEAVKLGWRTTNPAHVVAWSALENAARDAVIFKGDQFEAVPGVSYKCAHGYLFCRLPSGRCIAYPNPRTHEQVWARLQNEDGSWPGEAETVDLIKAQELERQGRARIDKPTISRITVLGVDSQTQKFVRSPIYGGLLMENICLGTERDILAAAMLRLEAAGYPVVMHTYDEAVAEVPDYFGSVEEMEAIMIERLDWFGDLPIAAEGFRAKRYRK
jgi:DNA polymerase